MVSDNGQYGCAVRGCEAEATHQAEVVGRDLEIGGIALPKAEFRYSAWLCDSHTLNDTEQIHLE